MKRILSRLAAVGAAAVLALGCSSAFAAEEPAPVIGVQLDGQPLAFTDAVPVLKNDRTFLPFRAVFEALGAEVGYDNGVVTATRDGKTITMTLGSTQASVTENGVTTPLVMDVAPYLDDATWRTYVPVRFAAQALDCTVGWDQANRTAIIVDTDKLVDKALEGKQFTYLEKLSTFTEQYSQGIWDCELTVDGAMSMLGLDMPLSAAAQATTEGESKVEMAMNMKLDMTQLAALTQQDAGEAGVPDAQATAAEQAMLESLKDQGMNMQLRGDLDKGTLYMNMSGAALESAGLDPNTWYSMDMNAFMDQAGLGMDWSTYMKAAQDVDYGQLVKVLLSGADVNSVETGYTGLAATVDKVVTALSDEGFTKKTLEEGDEYSSTITLQQNGATMAVDLTFGMKDGTVLGYGMGVEMTAQQEGALVSMDVYASMDDEGALRGEAHMDSSLSQDGVTLPLLNMELYLSGSYQQGKTAPVTEPPAGAQLVDLTDPEQVNGLLGISPLE